jgi:hypothetical protein
MTKRKSPQEVVAELTELVGKHEARRLLVGEGISTSTSDKLVRNRYEHEIKHLMFQAINRAYKRVKQAS